MKWKILFFEIIKSKKKIPFYALKATDKLLHVHFNTHLFIQWDV